MGSYSVVAKMAGQDGIVSSRPKDWPCVSPFQAWGRKHVLIASGAVMKIELRRDGRKIEDTDFEKEINLFVKGH